MIAIRQKIQTPKRVGLLAGFYPVAVVGPVLFATLILIQDLIEWNWLNQVGLNPIEQAPVSALEWSPIGFVQMANFLVLGAATVGLAVLLHKTVARNRFTYPALAVFLTIGVALIASAFRCDYVADGAGRSFINPPALHWMAVAHNIAFYFVALPVTFGPWLVWARLRKDPRYRLATRHTLIQAVVMVPLLVAVFTGPVIHLPVFYVWLLVWLSWQTHLAIRARQVVQESARVEVP